MHLFFFTILVKQKIKTPLPFLYLYLLLNVFVLVKNIDRTDFYFLFLKKNCGCLFAKLQLIAATIL